MQDVFSFFISKKMLVSLFCLGLVACSEPTSSSNAASTATTDSNETLASSTHPSGNVSLLQQLISPKMLGVDLAYFEQYSGIAKTSDHNEKTYDIEGCQVDVITDGKRVNALRLHVSPKCTADINPFFEGWVDTRIPTANQMTAADFEKITGNVASYVSDCISMCGNAFEPNMYVEWEGPHAMNSFQFYITLDQDNPSLEWADKLKARYGEEWVLEAKFNCGSFEANEMARPMFAKTRISAITLGTLSSVDRHC